MKTHVLLVDDDELVLSGLADGLSDAGFHVSTASSAEAALDLMAADPADVVVTDLVLGGMDGIELMRRLRHTYRNVPVLLITGQGSTSHAIAAMREGAADYIQKPAHPDDIARRLDTVLTAHRLRSRLEIDREEAQQEQELRDLQSSRAERFETALRFARGLAADLAPLADLLDSPPSAPLVAAWAPNDRAAAEVALQRIRELRTMAANPDDEAETFNLNDVVVAALDSPAIHLLRDGRPDIMVTFRPDNSPIVVRGHPAMLRSSLVGLFGAMLRAASRGGRVDITTTSEEFKDPWGHLVRGKSGWYGVVRVLTSIRLKPEEIDVLFEPYAVPRLTAGAGLAFPLMLLSMRAHRGLTFARDSASPPGFDIRLLIPLAAPETPAPAAAAPSADGLRVLVVDDTTHHRGHAAALLRQLHCHVDEAADSATALAMAEDAATRQAPYDLVLLDLILGEPTDGVDLTRQILALRDPPRVLLMGGFADLGRIAEGRTAGAAGYLQKPLTREALDHAIREAMARPPQDGAQLGDKSVT